MVSTKKIKYSIFGKQFIITKSFKSILTIVVINAI